VHITKLSEEDHLQYLRDLEEARRQWDTAKTRKESNRSASDAKYNRSAQGRARHRQYNASEKGRARRQRYEASPRGVAMRAAYEVSDRYLVNNRRGALANYGRLFELTGDVAYVDREPLPDLRTEEHHVQRLAVAISVRRQEEARQAELEEVFRRATPGSAYGNPPPNDPHIND
jgi:hypothetical protein